MKALIVQGNGKTHEASARRRVNLNFIEGLPLEGLKYKEKEKALLIYVTQKDERIYLEYPGKESERASNPNYRDFRPKISYGKSFGRDLTFGSVWGSFFELLKKHSVNDNEFILTLDYLVYLLYKSAYLIDFKKVDAPVFETFTVVDGTLKESSQIKYYAPILLYDVKQHLPLISFIQEKIGNLAGMSVEAFILYNDLLGWNEDFKYFYREAQKGRDWAGGTGKPNTLLTHISMLASIRGEYEISEILDKLVQTRGVCPPTQKELGRLFDNYINPAIESYV